MASPIDTASPLPAATNPELSALRIAVATYEAAEREWGQLKPRVYDDQVIVTARDLIAAEGRR